MKSICRDYQCTATCGCTDWMPMKKPDGSWVVPRELYRAAITEDISAIRDGIQSLPDRDAHRIMAEEVDWQAVDKFRQLCHSIVIRVRAEEDLDLPDGVPS